jgi:hypothetical protein
MANQTKKKAFSVYVRADNLSAAHCEFQFLVHATHFRLAINEALKQFRKNKNVRGKRIKNLRIGICELSKDSRLSEV